MGKTTLPRLFALVMLALGCGGRQLLESYPGDDAGGGGTSGTIGGFAGGRTDGGLPNDVATCIQFAMRACQSPGCHGGNATDPLSANLRLTSDVITRDFFKLVNVANHG